MGTRVSQVCRLLDRLAELLQPLQPNWADSMRRFLDRFVDGEAPSRVARDLLQLYTAGMGGWNDVVLQTAEGVSPDQRELSRLRTELFESARELL